MSASLVNEVETAFRKGTPTSRASALRRITGLFLEGADAYKEEAVGVFDDVLCQLIDTLERETLAELSGRIAPLNKAPPRLCARLARHDDIEVARPVLGRSPLLNDNLLVEIAQSKSQSHLEAIATRSRLSERVTDVLIDRGNDAVLTTVARNFGARLSTRGYRTLLGKAEKDVDLASAMVSRPELSPEMFRKLVAQATTTVQQRLLAATTDPEVKRRLQETLQSVSSVVAREVDRRAEVRKLPAHVVEMDKFKLKSELSSYVEAGKLTETVIVLSTLTELAGDTIRQLLACEEPDGLLIACKSCGLGWTTVRHLLELAAKARGAASLNAINYLDQYTKISRESADRVMRFLKVRKSASITDMKQMLAS